MKLYNEYIYEYTTYDTDHDHLKDELFLNLQAENSNEGTTKDPLDSGYNASELAKTTWKTLSHGANRIPGGPGSTKIALESVIGRTLGGEKLSPTQRKLYGLGAGLSIIGRGLTRLGAYTSNLWLTTPLPILSGVSSVIFAAAQASVVGGESNIGKIFKDNLQNYITKAKHYLQKINGQHIDTQTQEQISIIQSNIQQIETKLNEVTEREATNIVKEITEDLSKIKTDEQ